MSSPQSRLFWWRALLLLLFLAYTLLFLSLDALPFLDLPSHLSRAAAIIGLMTGRGFEDLFFVELGLQPYLWGDVLLGSLVSTLGPALAGPLWLTLSFVAVPGAMFVVTSRLRLPLVATLYVLFISIFVATDWFFLAAFTNFRFGIATSLLALSLFLGESEHEARKLTRTEFASFLVLALLTYLFHFASLFFLTIIVGVLSGLRLFRGEFSLRSVLLLLAPIAALGIFHGTQSEGHLDYFQPWVLRTLYQKVKAVGSMLVRFDLRMDVFFALVLALLLLIPLVGGYKHFRTNTRARELLAIFLALSVVYLLLPVAVATLSDIDGRALPFMALSLTLVAALVGPTEILRRQLFPCAVLLTTNLFYLAPPLLSQNRYLQVYQEALFQVPPRKRLLPVTTLGEIGRIHTTPHAGDLYTLYGKGFTPYISNAYLGEPFTYFHYRARYYAPLVFWYERKLSVEWQQVQDFYDYLIITKPFDEQAFPAGLLRPVFSNSAASVYEIRKDVALSKEAAGSTASRP